LSFLFFYVCTVEQNWTAKMMAQHFGRNIRTIFRWLQKYNISLRDIKYTAISKDDLRQELEKQMEMGHDYGNFLITSELCALYPAYAYSSNKMLCRRLS